MIQTWTQRNESALAMLEPIFAGRVWKLLEYMRTVEGEPILIVQGLRTWAEQDAIYAEGRTAPGRVVTQARSGFSQHNFGLAVDLCPDDLTLAGYQLDWNELHPVWKKLLTLAPQYKLAEGARWRTIHDAPHFYPEEIPGDTVELRSLYATGGIPETWRWFESLTQASTKLVV